MSVYLDTQIVVWLGEGESRKLTPKASAAIETSEIKVSPILILELEYLFEIKRIAVPSQPLIEKLSKLIGLMVSDYPFPAVIQSAVFEKWTRDPFDRIVVAHAKSDGYSGLITSDEKIRQHYSRAIW